MSANNTDRLPHLVWPWLSSTSNIIGGTDYVYLHLVATWHLGRLRERAAEAVAVQLST